MNLQINTLFCDPHFLYTNGNEVMNFAFTLLIRDTGMFPYYLPHYIYFFSCITLHNGIL